MHSVDQLCEDDLPELAFDIRSMKFSFKFMSSELTVLPLPVASDIPTRLCPCLKDERTDLMHSC